jgi:hypothetical protein
MDDRRFDALTRVLTAGDSRRRVLGLLATLPLLGGLLAFLAPEETAAKERRRRRKQRHKRRKKPGKRKHGCKPQGKGKVCAGRCGPVKSRQTCGKTMDCGPCTGCSATAPCASGQVCCGGSCFDGICCEAAECAPTGDDCVSNQCQCGNGGVCSGGAPVCWDGACACGDVCADGCQFTTVQAAIDALPPGSTIRLCAGTYTPFTVSKDVTLIGVGDGEDPASNTVLDGQDSARVMFIDPGVTVTLQGLRVTRGFVSDSEGGGISNLGNLTMTGCTVTDNHAVQPNPQGFGSAGAILNGPSATLTMTDCTISNNSAGIHSGGILLVEGAHTFTNCTFSGNTAGEFAGAMFLNNGGSATFTGCTIGPGNNAPDAAILVWNDAQLTLDDTTVFGNDGTTAGGVRNSSGSVILQNGSTVSGNTPTNCSGTITGDGCAP